eukprot:1654499-Rhodomonas_salina.4
MLQHLLLYSVEFGTGDVSRLEDAHHRPAGQGSAAGPISPAHKRAHLEVRCRQTSAKSCVTGTKSVRVEVVLKMTWLRWCGVGQSDDGGRVSGHQGCSPRLEKSRPCRRPHHHGWRRY